MAVSPNHSLLKGCVTRAADPTIHHMSNINRSFRFPRGVDYSKLSEMDVERFFANHDSGVEIVHGEETVYAPDVRNCSFSKPRRRTVETNSEGERVYVDRVTVEFTVPVEAAEASEPDGTADGDAPTESDKAVEVDTAPTASESTRAGTDGGPAWTKEHEAAAAPSGDDSAAADGDEPDEAEESDGKYIINSDGSLSPRDSDQ